MEPTQPQSQSTENKNLTVPIAIVIAGVLIAGALYITKKDGTVKSLDTVKPESAEIDLAPITVDDHILGDPNAPIVIVEYSDTECPFCKTFHGTMDKIMNEYGKDGRVAWVYRHFPLDQIHSKADKEAEATECAAELGGNDAFWKYLNRIFEITPSDNQLDLAKLPEIAVEIGLDKTKFETCLSSGTYAAKVESMFQSGVTAGVRGTPHSIIVTNKDGSKYPLEGAQSYQVIKTVIEAGLSDASKKK